MTSVLRLLPPTLIDRIAAGEVIERPAAALKELIENALDAGARRIEVAIDGGGIERIEVCDDGSGMTEAELALAVQRHATSKLPDDDLVRITTLGFRGEALPSIGAAARLTIVSRAAGAPHASRITVAGGAVGAVEPAAGARGTTVTVRDLFYATPARRKFLKSPRAEAEAAEATVRRLAFAAPGVAFRTVVDGRVALDLGVQERAARIGSLLGAQAAVSLLTVAHERDGLVLEGMVGGPALTRATTAAQSLVVNGRPVADPVLRMAVRVAYRDVIEAGRHPVVALYLTLPPETLDVNVHPAKTELRFTDADAVRALVIGGVRRALAAPAGVAGLVEAGAAGGAEAGKRPTLALWSRPAGRVVPRGFAEAMLPLDGAPSARVMDGAAPDAEAAHPLGAPVAQVLDTYIVALAADESLVLVDQHAAHERLTHEALAQARATGTLRSQALLLPVVVELSAPHRAALLDRAGALGTLGLELEGFGPGAVLLRAVPALLLEAGKPPDGAALLRDLAEEFAELDQSTALDALLDRAIARLACHGSVRAGRRLSQAEMQALLRRMEATPRAATCSHGRPTFLKLTRGDLERLFGRR
jgi:DNA mismatch repair protein MutL